MTTYNTGNPIGSTDARDRLDNTENMDILENSTTLNEHPDRLGVMRKTRKGMELEHDNQISAHESEHDAQISAHEIEHDAQMQSFENDFDSRLAGMAFTRSGTFTTGATLTDMRQTLLWEVSQGGDGREYGWTGSFLPSGKVVAAGSSPAPVSAGGWVDRTEDRLRSDIQAVDGDSITGYATYAQIRAYSGDLKSIRCGGRDAIYSGDGAHGKFYRDDSDTTSTDNDGTCLIDALGRRWKRRYNGYIDSRWLGTNGVDFVTDNYQPMMNAIAVAQSSCEKLYVKSGKYKLSNELTINPDLPFELEGDIGATFNGNTLIEKGTGFYVLGAGKSAFKLSSGIAKKKLSKFYCKNLSVGGSEYGISGKTYFTELTDIVCDGFLSALNFTQSLYVDLTRIIVRNCVDGIKFLESVGTPPYVLNSTYYNNQITVKQCQVVGGGTAYAFAGVGIEVDCCDASGYTVCGVQFGGDNFNLTQFKIGTVYTEGSTSTAIKTTNARGSIGNLFLGGNDSIGIQAVNSKLDIGGLTSYGNITVGVNASISSSVIINSSTGSIANVFTADATSIVRQIYAEQTKYTTFSLSSGASNTLVVNGHGSRHYNLDVYGSDNGTYFAIRVIQRAGVVYISGNKPTYLSITSTINGNGNYDITFTNTASFAYGLEIRIDYKLGYYSVAV